MRRIIRRLWDWLIGRDPWLDEQHARLEEFKRLHSHLYKRHKD